MSIAVLNQVYDETRRLSVAGSSLAVGDFRLKKLVAPLRKAGQKAPVFSKVADSIEELVDGSEKSSPQALLDLSSLVLAIMYTQGQTGTKGTAKPIKSIEVQVSTTQVSSRVLKPLMEALTTTGSGRLETVRDAYERGAFNDLRLVNPAIQSLDDVYPELADFMAETVLPSYGAAIVPEIEHRIDIKGKAGNARRLKLLHQLDAQAARPLVEEAFEKGAKEMKIAALACLGDSPQDLPHLLEQADAKTKEIRRVALERLAHCQGADVEATFRKALASADVDLVTSPISASNNTKLVILAQQQTEACLEELLATRDKKKAEKLVNRLDALLCCFYGRQEKSTVKMLQTMFQQRAEIAKKPAGSSILERLCGVMTASGQKKLLQLTAEVHPELDDKSVEAFSSSVLAVLATRSPKQAYDELHGYYVRPGGRRRRALGRYEVVVGLLCNGLYDGQAYFRHQHLHFARTAQSGTDALIQNVKWDPRWIDLAIAKNDVQTVCGLATSKHKGAGDYLVQYLNTPGKKSTDHWETGQVVAALVNIKHKQATDLVLDVLAQVANQKGSRYWLSYSVIPLISKLPKASFKKVEAGLEGLPESMIDDIMPYLMTLKQQAK